MVAIEKDGYFIQGVWFKGLYPPNFVGRKIIRTCPCNTHYGEDFSYSVIGKYWYPRLDEYATLHKINSDGSMCIEWHMLRGDVHKLEPEWNDGNWILLDDAIREYGKMETVMLPIPQEVLDQPKEPWNEEPDYFPDDIFPDDIDPME